MLLINTLTGLHVDQIWHLTTKHNTTYDFINVQSTHEGVVAFIQGTAAINTIANEQNPLVCEQTKSQNLVRTAATSQYMRANEIRQWIYN